MEQCLKSDLFLYVACGLISSNPESGLKLFDDLVKEGKVSAARLAAKLADRSLSDHLPVDLHDSGAEGLHVAAAVVSRAVPVLYVVCAVCNKHARTS